MPDRHLIPLFIFGTLLIIGFAIAVVISLIVHKQRQTKAKLARQQMQFDYSQSLLNTRIEVQNATLNLVAQELHDNVVQSLTGCFMQVEALDKYVDQSFGGSNAIEEIQTNIERVISDVRLLSHSLASGMNEQRELHEAIQTELSRLERFGSIRCTLRADTIYELEPEKRLVAYRIIQEVLQNVLKHAQATNVAVLIDCTDTHYHLQVKDDGIGFNTSAQRSTTSLGLVSINERVGLLNGCLTVKSAEGGGTEVNIFIPFETA